MAEQRTLREQVVEKFKQAFGEPEVTTIQSGDIYRWALSRGPTAVSMFITVDSPEHTDIAYAMISDGSAHQVEPVVAVTIRTLAEADAVIERIIKQWKSFRQPRQ